MDDLISRKAAIDAVMNTEPVFDSQSFEPFQKTKDVINALEELPSAQPEIIRCKDCKWWGDIGCAIKIVDESDKPKEDDFCSFAERWEENHG